MKATVVVVVGQADREVDPTRDARPRAPRSKTLTRAQPIVRVLVVLNIHHATLLSDLLPTYYAYRPQRPYLRQYLSLEL